MTAASDDPESDWEAAHQEKRLVCTEEARRAELKFCVLYRDLVPKLAAYLIVAHRASKPEAAECAHEALVEYHLHQDGVGHPLAWCRRAARSIFLKRTYNAVESFADIPATGAPLYRHDHADRADDADQRGRLVSLVRQLPPHQREVIALALEGLSYAAIAVELEHPESTIRSHARHARDHLAELHRSTRHTGEADQ